MSIVGIVVVVVVGLLLVAYALPMIRGWADPKRALARRDAALRKYDAAWRNRAGLGDRSGAAWLASGNGDGGHGAGGDASGSDGGLDGGNGGEGG